ncbi:MAG: hypothetical protein ACOY95_17135 [Pseudomonadota bacterium]|jgi:hypothetical protein
MITTQSIPNQVTFDEVLEKQVLFHPSVGMLDLGMSSDFHWAAMPLVRKPLPGYQACAGLYAAWQREDHALELLLRAALDGCDLDSSRST